LPRSAISPLGVTPNLNQKVENATLKNYSVEDLCLQWRAFHTVTFLRLRLPLIVFNRGFCFED